MSAPEIDRPVVIVSAGRSGSSVFHEILTHHPDVCWLPRGCGDRPAGLGRYRWVFRALDLPGVGPLLRRRYEPVEGYEFWDHHYAGFSRSCRDLRADDVTPRARASLRGALGELPTGGRPRLVLKVTGWPRVGFLREVLPDARFVHVVRDGRSVAASLLQVPWWRGWEGPESWRFGPLSPQERETWERHDRSFVALAGIEWTKVVEAMEESRSRLAADDWHTVRYEDMCRDPVAVFRATLEFGGLPAVPRFLDVVDGFGLESRNPKWRRNLDDEQQSVLEDVVASRLADYGYA